MNNLRTIPIEKIGQFVEYNCETGDFIHKKKRYAGKVAGTFAKTGYRQLMIDGKTMLAHRVAWAIVHGAWPDGDIDHINGERSDNRICNLRLATRSQNLQNIRKIRGDNRCGVTGVFFNAKHNKWQAQITSNGKGKYLGLFEDKSSAAQAYATAKRELHPFAEIYK